MALTLSLQDSLLLTTGEFQKGVVETQAREFKILEKLPIKVISSSSHVWNNIGELPDIPFRKIGEPIVPSKIIYQQDMTSLAILSDELSVDVYSVETGEVDVEQLALIKVKAIHNKFERSFLNGDQSKEPKGFNGLAKLVAPQQIVKATANIANDMDYLSDKVSREASAFIMSKSTLTLLEAQNRELITFSTGEFGKPLTHYGDVPIIDMEDDMMPVGRIFAVRFDEEDGVCGISTAKGMDMRPIGEVETAPQIKVRVEWYCGLAVKSASALAMRG